jgi:hypothetical protein
VWRTARRPRSSARRGFCTRRSGAIRIRLRPRDIHWQHAALGANAWPAVGETTKLDDDEAERLVHAGSRLRTGTEAGGEGGDEEGELRGLNAQASNAHGEGDGTNEFRTSIERSRGMRLLSAAVVMLANRSAIRRPPAP